MVKVFLLKEMMYSIEEDLLPSFRKLSEQVGYRTHYHKSSESLFLKPWLDGKRIILHLYNVPEKEINEKILNIPSKLEQLLSPYGPEIVFIDKWKKGFSLDQSTRFLNDTMGDIHLFLQKTKNDQTELIYVNSNFETSKSLATSIYHGFIQLPDVKISRPICLWNPFSQDKYRKMIAKVDKPAVLIKLPTVFSSESIIQGILQGILNYFHVPILLPQNQSPGIWEQIILQVLEFKKHHQLHSGEQLPPIEVPEPILEEQLLEESNLVDEVLPAKELHHSEQLTPIVQSEPAHDIVPLHLPTENPPQQPIPAEKLPPLAPAQPAAHLVNIKELIQARVSQSVPNQKIIERLQSLQTNHTQDHSWDSLISQGAWNQSPFMRSSSIQKQNGPTINPFAKKKQPNNPMSYTTINPFSKGKR